MFCLACHLNQKADLEKTRKGSKGKIQSLKQKRKKEKADLVKTRKGSKGKIQSLKQKRKKKSGLDENPKKGVESKTQSYKKTSWSWWKPKEGANNRNKRGSHFVGLVGWWSSSTGICSQKLWKVRSSVTKISAPTRWVFDRFLSVLSLKLKICVPQRCSLVAKKDIWGTMLNVNHPMLNKSDFWNKAFCFANSFQTLAIKALSLWLSWGITLSGDFEKACADPGISFKENHRWRQQHLKLCWVLPK